MSTADEIVTTLRRFTITNGASLDAIKEVAVEVLQDSDCSGREIPVMVTITMDATIHGIHDVEDQICDLLLSLSKRRMDWKMIKQKMLPVPIIFHNTK